MKGLDRLLSFFMSQSTTVARKLRSREIISDEPVNLRTARSLKQSDTKQSLPPNETQSGTEESRPISKAEDTARSNQPPAYSESVQPLEQIPVKEDEVFEDVPTEELIANFQKLRCEEIVPITTQQTSVAPIKLDNSSAALPSAPLYPSDKLKRMTDCREVSITTEVNRSDATASKMSEKPQVTDQYQLYRSGLGHHASGNDINTVHVADSVLAPKPFSEVSTEDPEEWLEYFERYTRYRNMTEPEKVRLFPMFLRNGASDWFSTLPERATESYYYMRGAFIENFFRSPELLWKTAGDLFNQAQKPDERVDDFVTRVKKCAKQLNMTEEMLHYAVLHGLRGPIRLHVLQSGIKDLNETVRAARIAEASNASDPLTALLLETLKTTTQSAQKQASDIKELSAKVSSLTVATSNLAQ